MPSTTGPGNLNCAAESLRKGLVLVEDLLGTKAVADEFPEQLADLFERLAADRARRADREESRRLCEEAVALLGKYRPERHPKRIDARLALQQAVQAEKLAPDLKKSLQEALQLTAQLQLAVADSAKAITFIRKAQPLYKTSLGADSLAFADVLTFEGALREKQKESLAAADLYRQAVPISNRLRGLAHPDAVLVQDSLTRVLYRAADAAVEKEDHAAGCKGYAEIVEVRAEWHGKDDWRIARRAFGWLTRNDWRKCHPSSAKVLAAYQVALDYYSLSTPQEVLAARPKGVAALVAACEQALGADSQEFANFLARLGTSFFTEGGAEMFQFASPLALDLAESLLKRALLIRVKATGANSLDEALSLHQLGIVYRLRAEYDRAADHFRRALAIREKHLPPNHDLVVGSLNSLGVTLWQAGDPMRAEPLLRHNLELVREAFRAAGTATGDGPRQSRPLL